MDTTTNTAEQSRSAELAAEKLSTKDLRRITWSSWLGTSLDYMDFTLYTLASAMVFGPLFFPEQTPGIALISSLGIYGAGFVVRPFGGVYFGRLGDNRGRRVVLFLTLILMGGATMLIGLLPTYAAVGILAPILLVFLRMIQGFAAGAELAGASIILVEAAPKDKRGFYGSFVGVGTAAGVLLASTLWFFFTLLPRQEFLAWGWRIPFLLSIFTTVVALYIRTGIKESPVFIAAKERKRQKMREAESVWREAFKSRKAFLVALGMRLGENASVYLVKAFLVGWAVTRLDLNGSNITLGIMIGSFLGILLVPFFGALSDKVGRRKVFLFWTVFQILFVIPSMVMLESRNEFLVALVFVIFLAGPLPNMYATEATWIVELFGSKHRYTFSATLKEIGAVIAGGFAPVAAAALVAWFTEGWWPVASILLVYAAFALLGGLFAPETKGRDLTAEEDAL